ncbi:topless-related protein 4 [Brassica napus]|uniref:topless-related protein 4 n=1 Tax=Brassica napus TaxID=3708 RepID=UPI0020794553|nr:topless-related protein 4 [Brassica napus]
MADGGNIHELRSWMYSHKDSEGRVTNAFLSGLETFMYQAGSTPLTQESEDKHSAHTYILLNCVNWQHQLCKTPRPDPDIKTLFTDHTCAVPNGPLAPSSVNPPVTTLTKPTAFPSLGAHGPFPPGTAIAAANSANWTGLPKVCSCLGKRFMCEGWFSSIV